MGQEKGRWDTVAFAMLGGMLGAVAGALSHFYLLESDPFLKPEPFENFIWDFMVGVVGGALLLATISAILDRLRRTM
jgi:zinc transporter ZupT